MVPGSLLLPFVIGVTDDVGAPLTGGKLYTYAPGTTDAQSAFSDVDCTVAHPNPIVLDALGRASIYLSAQAYKLVLTDADGALQWTQDNVLDVGQVHAATVGSGQGGKDVSNGYAVTDDDDLVTVDGTSGPNPCEVFLPPAVSRPREIRIKNVGSVPLAVTPDGTDTLDGVAGPFTVPAASGASQPAIILSPDPVDTTAWHIVASHKVP